MTSCTLRRRHLVLAFLMVAIVALGWVGPASAASRFYAEAPMQVQWEGLTVEEHLQRQVVLSHDLASQLPAGALERAIQVPLSAAEIAAIDQAPRWVSPLKVGVVKPIASAIGVAG